MLQATELPMAFAFKNHTRHDLYRLWRDVRQSYLEDREAAPSEAGTGRPPFPMIRETDVPARRQRVLDGLIRLLQSEDSEQIECGALSAAANQMIDLLRIGTPVVREMFLANLRGIARLLGTVSISQRHLELYTFIEDVATPLDVERDLLEIAIEMDQELYNGETNHVPLLARAVRVEGAAVRRILCRWMDDGIAYVPDAALDEDDEPFHLEERATLRLRNWDRYESERLRMNKFNFVIEAPRPFPNNAIELVTGIGREHGLRFDGVHEASRGIQVDGVFPTEWTPARIAEIKAQIIQSVQATFVEARRHEMPSGGVIVNTYNAHQVAAQGPNAVAIGNTLVQQLESTVADKLSAEILKLREHLQTTIKSSSDAVEVGAVGEAEEAAKRKDQNGLVAAVKKWGAKALGKIETLGLSFLQAWISVHLGIPPASTPALPAGDGATEKQTRK
jgi:hypothetical protein